MTGSAPPWPAWRDDFAERARQRADEVTDVSRLLMAHADPDAGPVVQVEAVARAIAVACLGDDHLWQDLLLPDRGALNCLLTHWFPSLVAKNRSDMKWKKFLYRQLCEEAEILICKSPSCATCSDVVLCFESPPRVDASPFVIYNG